MLFYQYNRINTLIYNGFYTKDEQEDWSYAVGMKVSSSNNASRSIRSSSKSAVSELFGSVSRPTCNKNEGKKKVH